MGPAIANLAGHEVNSFGNAMAESLNAALKSNWVSLNGDQVTMREMRGRPEGCRLVIMMEGTMTLLVSLRGIRPATRWSVTVACGAVLVLSGCQKSEAPQVASAAPQGQAVAPASSAGAGPEAELAAYLAGKRKWVDCMREHKIELSDPDAKGEVTSPYKPGDPKADKGPESSKAGAACQRLVVNPSPELAEYLRPPLTPAQVDAYKNFAVCMRKNGVSDFGDPMPGRKDVPPIMGSAGATKSYLKAQDTCFDTAEMKSAYPGWSPQSGGAG